MYDIRQARVLALLRGLQGAALYECITYYVKYNNIIYNVKYLKYPQRVLALLRGLQGAALCI